MLWFWRHLQTLHSLFILIFHCDCDIPKREPWLLQIGWRRRHLWAWTLEPYWVVTSLFHCLLGQWRYPQKIWILPDEQCVLIPGTLPVAVQAGEMPGRIPGPIPCSLLLEWEQSDLLELQLGPKHDREALGPQESVSEMFSTAQALQPQCAGAQQGWHWDSHWNCQHHSDSAFSTIIPAVLWGRVCSRPGREAGAEISRGLCQMLQAPSEQLGLIWVFLHSHAVQSQVLVSDYRGCSWGCFQCREHVLKLLKHSSPWTQTFFYTKWKSWVWRCFPGPSALPHFYRLKSL